MRIVSQRRFEPMQTECFEVDCDCGTYLDNEGVCGTFHLGELKRCVYCDHAIECHQFLSRRKELIEVS